MTPGVSSSKVRRNFSRSACSYDSVAFLQKEAAAVLALRAADAISGSASPEILELGCGTGLLTAELLRLAPASSSILATDISAAMLELCDGKFAQATATGALRLKELDFTKPFPDGLGRFDLVASSFAFQWSGCVAAAIRGAAQLLKPRGAFCAAVPLAGSLEELRRVFSESGLPFPGLQLPEEAALLDALKACLSGASCDIRLFSEGPFPLAEALRRFQSLGAVNVGEAMKTAPLRRLLLDARDAQVKLEYRVAFLQAARG